MTSHISPNPQLFALLSATGISGGAPAGHGGALWQVAGQPLLACQMNLLEQHGLRTFLIEVDSVPGELLNLADNFRQRGVRVEFVRCAKDLQNFLNPSGMLIVQAEAHYFSAQVLNQLMNERAPFVAIVDSRDENGAFERIDLSTRWAGFAILEVATAKSLAALPDGWSIASSLLRCAVQSAIPVLQIAQASLNNGNIVCISTQEDADRLVARMLKDETAKQSGFIERKLFGVVATRLAPTIWAARQGRPIVGATRLTLAAVSVVCAAMGWTAAAAAAAFNALFFDTLFGLVQGVNESPKKHDWQYRGFWATLVAAAFVSGWMSTDYNSDTLAFVVFIVGLVFLSQRMSLPRWSAAVLRSRALVAVAMLISAVFSLFALGAKIIAMVQLGMLILALYLPESSRKNSNHA